METYEKRKARVIEEARAKVVEEVGERAVVFNLTSDEYVVLLCSLDAGIRMYERLLEEARVLAERQDGGGAASWMQSPWVYEGKIEDARNLRAEAERQHRVQFGQ